MVNKLPESPIVTRAVTTTTYDDTGSGTSVHEVTATEDFFQRLITLKGHAINSDGTPRVDFIVNPLPKKEKPC